MIGSNIGQGLGLAARFPSRKPANGFIGANQIPSRAKGNGACPIDRTRSGRHRRGAQAPAADANRREEADPNGESGKDTLEEYRGTGPATSVSPDCRRPQNEQPSDDRSHPRPRMNPAAMIEVTRQTPPPSSTIYRMTRVW